MRTYTYTSYGIADRTNYSDRRTDFRTLDEALENLLKMTNPKKYLITKSEFSRVFDDNGVFQREVLQTTKVDISLWEIRECTEMGYDGHLKYFTDIQKAFDYSNLQERYNPGYHYYHIEHKI